AFFSLEEDGEFACTVTDAFFDEVEKQIALSQLAESERRLLQMSASGYKSREIGKTLGISASAVRSRIAAAREKLNEYL
ncbi:MAG TPA: sigma factor-like helix-turn-helix DNA-binding protein, partial [Clostridiales bacterium]|nr:sigma factor-like helix-turn-helix DNA-binding protein [Clostridiales bacterium]